MPEENEDPKPEKPVTTNTTYITLGDDPKPEDNGHYK